MATSPPTSEVPIMSFTTVEEIVLLHNELGVPRGIMAPKEKAPGSQPHKDQTIHLAAYISDLKASNLHFKNGHDDDTLDRHAGYYLEILKGYDLLSFYELPGDAQGLAVMAHSYHIPGQFPTPESELVDCFMWAHLGYGPDGAEEREYKL